jgi:predicted metal-dependent enzyme (double-stranded beta helix superfamily)
MSQCVDGRQCSCRREEIVARAVAEPSQVFKALGEPKLAGIQTLYRSDSLTILNVLWGPSMRLYPHNHLMWAVIGIYNGREDNSFYRRSENGLIELGAKTVDTKDVIPLGEAVIHSVTNPLEQSRPQFMAAVTSLRRRSNRIQNFEEPI